MYGVRVSGPGTLQGSSMVAEYSPLVGFDSDPPSGGAQLSREELARKRIAAMQRANTDKANTDADV